MRQGIFFVTSRQTEAPNLGSGLFVWSCGEEDLNRATAPQRRGKLSCGQFASLRENPFIRTKILERWFGDFLLHMNCGAKRRGESTPVLQFHSKLSATRIHLFRS